MGSVVDLESISLWDTGNSRVGVYAVPERLTVHHFSGGLEEIHVALAKRGLLEADQVRERVQCPQMFP